jgi:hypothetical protein
MSKRVIGVNTPARDDSVYHGTERPETDEYDLPCTTHTVTLGSEMKPMPNSRPPSWRISAPVKKSMSTPLSTTTPSALASLGSWFADQSPSQATSGGGAIVVGGDGIVVVVVGGSVVVVGGSVVVVVGGSVVVVVAGGKVVVVGGTVVVVGGTVEVVAPVVVVAGRVEVVTVVDEEEGSVEVVDDTGSVVGGPVVSGADVVLEEPATGPGPDSSPPPVSTMVATKVTAATAAAALTAAATNRRRRRAASSGSATAPAAAAMMARRCSGLGGGPYPELNSSRSPASMKRSSIPRRSFPFMRDAPRGR